MNDKKRAKQSLTKSLNGSALNVGPTHLDRLGQFRIGSVIGSGGMGTVYLAYDESMKRKLALKILHPMMEISGTAEQRFAREAWIAGKLDHPNIIKVYGRGEIQGIKYMTLELADGGSLSDFIKLMKPSAPGEDELRETQRSEYIRGILEKFIGLASALSQIHAKGIIHRDIKPLNILLGGPDKIFKLTDFGIAHAEDMTKMTRAGDFIGTIKYMSPELLTAHRAKVDHRADIYSLGLTLYETLTLALPYDESTEQKYITEVLAGHSIPAHRLNKKITTDLETILMKAMHHDPDERFQSADDFAADLRRYLENRPVLARRPGPVIRTIRFIKRHKIASLLVSIVLVLLIGKFAWDSHQKSMRLAIEQILSALESNETNQVSEPGLTELKNALLSKRLGPAQNMRVARTLLNPEILVSDYVSRKGQSRIICLWPWQDSPLSSSPTDLKPIVRPTIRIGDFVTIQEKAYSPIIQNMVVSSEKLKSLPLGENKIELVLQTWIFDEEQVKKKFSPEKGYRSIWNPAVYLDKGGYKLVFGPEEKKWEDIWAELEASSLAVWKGEVKLSKNFQVVDELPGNFPLAVRSPALDKDMKEAVMLKDFEFGNDEPLAFVYTAESAKPLPAPLAGRLEILTGDHILLGTLTLGHRQGEKLSVSFVSNLERPSPANDSQKNSRAKWIEKIKSGEEIPIILRFVASRDVAAREPGFNSYWDGELVFEGNAHLRK